MWRRDIDHVHVVVTGEPDRRVVGAGDPELVGEGPGAVEPAGSDRRERGVREESQVTNERPGYRPGS
jgi:hypothetical protein